MISYSLDASLPHSPFGLVTPLILLRNPNTRKDGYVKGIIPESTVATSGRDGCKLVAVFEVKKQIRADEQHLLAELTPGQTGGKVNIRA
jgi:hypothetical protein